MWRAEGKWLPKTSRKVRRGSRFCSVLSVHCVLPTRPPHSLHEHGHLKIYLPKKLLECLPKCSSLPKERHRWNTNEVRLPLPFLQAVIIKRDPCMAVT
uniref:Calmodulin binding transcription activator 1 n=1 Tax=Denticeps clupeoides TaxID=299321 RepID=A0AAY4ECX3_9TELE